MTVNSTDPAAPASPGERLRPQARFPVTLEGQPALVTGANSGIGRAVALGLAAAGADVVVNYVVDPVSAEEVVHEIEARGRKAIAIKADVSNEDDVRSMFARAIDHFGTLHIVVNNAGLQRDAPLHEMTIDQWNKVIGVNLTGQFLCAREAVREFKRRGIVGDISAAAGKLVCMSSVHQEIPWAGHANYAASKGGVMQHRAGSRPHRHPRQRHRTRRHPDAHQSARLGDEGSVRKPDDAGALQAHRRAGRHRAGGRLARLRRRRLRHRRHPVHRRRHDPIPRLRKRRLGKASGS
ncbi:SDR family NAD(P)-dependent oxidoreductase [Bradyrhizobium ottawaense]